MKSYQVFIIALTLTIIGATPSFSKKKSVPTIYIYGVSYSFKDTLVHITSIQEIENAWIDAKSNFLSDRNYYSYQLKEHFNKKGDEYRVCAVFYAQKRKDVEKKYIKMMKKFSKNGNVDVRQIPDEEFHFKTEVPDPDTLADESELTKAERKALKAAAKNQKKKSSKKKQAE